MKTRETVTVVVITRRIHFGVSCGEGGIVSYEANGENGLYGLPFEMLGIRPGDGDRYEVTITRLPRLQRGPRFPRNPWLHRRKRKATR